MKIEQISSADTLSLRSKVLRPGKPISTCHFDGDDAPQTRHFGAINHQGQIVGIVSVYQQDSASVSAHNPYQLRAMAIDTKARGQGIGVLLLNAAESYLQSCGCDRVWANARTVALGFYTKQGYQELSEEFVIENVGPHYLVAKTLVL
ncbi:GNAT family N-acetyltransferase [Pseudohongiella nitratireducens]|uniref:GNAT family N-acetyltransferase n=1 Tax=Pseudohongiella nitratireducens TaxID=1768907 RepID=UPI0030EB7080|tara:strand:- start:317 stop:760 length:444 start_codon:yes stop_codon:yes gene_type:complete